ncbi:MAG: type II/IV secretion system protein [Nitrospira sp.]|nr:type II/IV secretion system protein [Nitrospira sp.]MCA9476042.1 type II/IV secretion system protein [Nitrospira sp.]MCA9479208.1 type II/IV secretion system protein [Nitrospira sp.]MCB9712199.1 type II/IV secretion system protein [Nitrospiraceae bacterium]MDR4488036.1 GspE/PulE family protein [Nitrospirales bacterium]
MTTPVKRIGFDDLLVKKGLVSEREKQNLQEAARASNQTVTALLLERGTLTEPIIGQVLADQYGLPWNDLREFRIPTTLMKIIPIELMHRYGFVPIDQEDDVLTIAIADPQNLRMIDELEHELGYELRLVVSSKSAIQDALGNSEGNSQVLTRIKAELDPVLIKEDEKGEEVLSVERITQDLSPVVKLVNTIILTALQKHASDIHIEPTERSVEVKFRIDGVLYLAMDPFDAGIHGSLISRLKIMSELDIAERRIPQDGRFKMLVNQRTIDFRVSILPSVYGESVVIRILDKQHVSAGVQGLRLEALGYTGEDLARFRRAIIRPYGMVLVTGPTGSGKTTTLYAALNEVHSDEDKIITIEDPVEYQLKGIVQIPVNEKKGLTFARGLRSILRHDPDKIMVGEIRDLETAQIAIQSALTGHLVFTTVHANNAFDVISRFVNMGIEPYNFVTSLSCILAQRLVRSICQACRVPIQIHPDQCQESGIDYDAVKHVTFYEGKGCHECNGLGFRGRKAITEFVDMTDSIKEMILHGKSSSEIRVAAMAQGMTSLRQAALEKVFRGETTLKEINRVTPIEET